jgi:hypothetical protein
MVAITVFSKRASPSKGSTTSTPHTRALPSVQESHALLEALHQELTRRQVGVVVFCAPSPLILFRVVVLVSVVVVTSSPDSCSFRGSGGVDNPRWGLMSSSADCGGTPVRSWCSLSSYMCATPAPDGHFGNAAVCRGAPVRARCLFSSYMCAPLTPNGHFGNATVCCGAPVRAWVFIFIMNVHHSCTKWSFLHCSGVPRLSRACVVLIFSFLDCSGLPLAAPGCSWLLSAAPGYSWLLPAAPGCLWLLLATLYVVDVNS